MNAIWTTSQSDTSINVLFGGYGQSNRMVVLSLSHATLRREASLLSFNKVPRLLSGQRTFTMKHLETSAPVTLSEFGFKAYCNPTCLVCVGNVDE